jgi:glyoxylase-like metal-dependent hydrolase (beta-lactamase superfamily II)
MSTVPQPRSILAPNPSPMTLDGTRTHIVGMQRPVVIDPGPAVEDHLEAILRELDGARPVAIFLTHAHADHSGSAPAVAAATGAPIWMGAGAVSNPLPPGSVDRWVAEGERLETDAGVLQVIATPGHTPEHLSLVWRGHRDAGEGGLFAGDLLMGGGDTTLVAPPEGDLGAYLDTLSRLAGLGLSVAFPAHGPPIRDLADALRRYRAHREQRIDAVRSALDRTPGGDLDALVRAVYGPDLDPRLKDAARGSLRAVLDYLRSRS